MNSKRRVIALGLPILAVSLVIFGSYLWAHVPPGVTLVPGRMTGGGSIFLSGPDLVFGQPADGAEIRVTHGFEVHCSPDIVPNNLQINIHKPNGEGGKFHLELLTFAACWDDPSIEPNPPAAPFDHYFGFGVGRFNGNAGYCAQWLFTDAGERGTEDRIKYLRIWTGDGCGTAGPFDGVVTVEEPGHPLTFGNHQAHKENK